MTEQSVTSEIVVVGAGPAGLAAAATAAESGRRVMLVDETPWLGGQIWRGKSRSLSLPAAAIWFARLKNSGAAILDRTCVIAAPEHGLLLAERDGSSCQIRWERLILATGARELFLPFPGWTLPGVVGPGGLLVLVKNGWPISGRRVVVAGSGPLLLAVADGLRRHGACVLGLIEQAPRARVLAFGMELRSHPAKLLQAAQLKLGLWRVTQHYGAWPIRAEGADHLERVILTNGRKTWTESCDLLACAFGLVPNTELACLLGCEIHEGFVTVDLWQATTSSGVYCAGEPTGIGGVDCALVEGQIAGYSASGRPELAEKLFPQRARWHQFRASLARAFGLRAELKSLAAEETIVCRCEDVTMGHMRRFGSWREAKLHSRCGMGSCQGRVCGAAANVILGWKVESQRPPMFPVEVRSLVS